MKLTRSLIVSVFLTSALASAQEVAVTVADRYFEVSSNILNEPCLIYAGVGYRAQLILDDRSEDGLYWAIVSGEEIDELPTDCETVQQSVFTDDPSIPSVSYNVEGVIVAEAGIDTGLRYDIGSRADATRLDLGFHFDSIHERRAEEKVVLTGAGSVSFSGPASFPFEVREEAFQWIGVNKNFDGSLNYNAETNKFTVTFDAGNEAGDYTLTVRFNDFGFGRESSVGLLLEYPIEFHVI